MSPQVVDPRIEKVVTMKRSLLFGLLAATVAYALAICHAATTLKL